MNPLKRIAVLESLVTQLRLDNEALKKEVADLKVAIEFCDVSVRSVIAAKTAPEETKEEAPLATPRPLAWHERRDAFVASRRDPRFLEKVLASKSGNDAKDT